VAEKATGSKEVLRWLVGDDEALVEVLRRESARGIMRCDQPGVRGRGIYRP
jgi:hypothetical protein